MSSWFLRGCLYGGEPAQVPELARFAELISSRFYMRWNKQLVRVTATNINIFHEPEIRTFASNFHGYNPHCRSQRRFKIEICREIYSREHSTGYHYRMIDWLADRLIQILPITSINSFFMVHMWHLRNVITHPYTQLNVSSAIAIGILILL
jgi:hypothetical protein